MMLIMIIIIVVIIIIIIIIIIMIVITIIDLYCEALLLFTYFESQLLKFLDLLDFFLA